MQMGSLKEENMKKILLITVIMLAAVCLALAGCGGGSGGGDVNSAKLTFHSVRVIPALNGLNEDSEGDVCLQVSNNITENYDVEINLNNAAGYTVNSIVVNDEEITAKDFGSGSDNNTIYLRDQKTALKEGEFTVTVSEVKYSVGSEARTLSITTDNTVRVRVNPTFTVVFDMSASNLPDGAASTQEVSVSYGAAPSAPLDNDMNGTSEGQYGVEGYIFAGWYTEPEGGEKFEANKNYLYYSDLTVYARYARAVKYSSDGESVTVTGLTDEGKATSFEIIIPSEIDGLPVTTIGRYAFSSVGSNKSFVLPASVKTIDEGAFQNCVNMMIDLGSVEVIGRAAFQDCGTIYLGRGNRNSAERVASLPSTLKEIGDYAFRRSGFDVTRIYIPGRDNYLYDNGLDRTVIIPAGVTKIGKYAFSESLFVKVLFEKGSAISSDISVITENKDDEGYYDYSGYSIGEGVFSGSTSLTTVFTGFTFTTSGSQVIVAADGGLPVITDYMFYNCTSLKPYDQSQTYPTGVYLGEGLKWIGALAFASASGMTNYTSQRFPASLETIGMQAFANVSLQSVSFPTESKLKTLGDWCFQETEFSDITIYNLSSYYGKDPFWGNLNIRTINLLTRFLPAYSVPTTTTLTRYARIYVYADMLARFRSDKNWSYKVGNYVLTDFSRSATDLMCAYEYQTDAFCYEPVNENGEYDPNSTNVRISFIKSREASVTIDPWFTVGSGDNEKKYTVTRIGGYALLPEVSEISLPDTVQYIEAYAFYINAALTKVNWTHDGTALGAHNISDISLKEIGDYAFYATAIEEFYSNSALTAIGAQAFHLCTKLTTVVLDKGDNLTIGSSAFSQSALKTLIISKNVVSLGNSAFQNQTEELTIYIERTTPYMDWSIFPFLSCNNVKTVYVFGTNTIDNYVDETGWNAFKTKYKTYTSGWASMLTNLGVYS